MSWSRALSTSPDMALVLFTLGVLLICVELNRPGAILPGALGLALALISVAALLRLDLSEAGVAMLATAATLLLLDLFRPTPVIVAAAATLALCLGFDQLIAGPGRLRIHTVAAVPCGLLLGAGTSWLTRIARRARANKAVD